ncbi:hypothetical protein AYI70_g2820 [Smittium culicis]|uniref:Reverse transcriptase domain-containing protein n=1 Tax=Smittium culicis TaxID=133412 RepID=A0A1R1Y6E6_9FUNG|nr:hypothetical protein AYI70_g2820 [Smittium culicis]
MIMKISAISILISLALSVRIPEIDLLFKRIVNRDSFNSTEFPYFSFIQVYVDNFPTGYCGGSFINSKHILTSADCLFIDSSTPEPPSSIVVEQWILMQEILLIMTLTLNRNITILELKEPVLSYVTSFAKICDDTIIEETPTSLASRGARRLRPLNQRQKTGNDDEVVCVEPREDSSPCNEDIGGPLSILCLDDSPLVVHYFEHAFAHIDFIFESVGVPKELLLFSTEGTTLVKDIAIQKITGEKRDVEEPPKETESSSNSESSSAESSSELNSESSSNTSEWENFYQYSDISITSSSRNKISVGLTETLIGYISGTYNNFSGKKFIAPSRRSSFTSPILFDFYINDIFKGVRGVRVPGLTSRIPGLLFADDGVLLAELSAYLQIALKTIIEWSDTWEMAVNASKCGIMTISGELTTDMTLQGQKVDSTDQYTYLGYIMNSKWDVSGKIKNNKNKVMKAVYAAYSFLRRSDVLTALKIKFINSVLMPIRCYGGETFGMSEARCKLIQMGIDKAIRMVANVGKSAAMERIRDALGITSVFMRTSTARERAYHKWPTIKTWIADLIKTPMKARMTTWATGSACWFKKLCSQDSNGQTIITIVDRKRRNNRSVIHQWTVDQKIGKKGNWVDLQAMYPDLELDLQEIGKMRMVTLRSAQSLSNMKIVDQKFKNFCPCCNVCVPEMVDHILLSCSRLDLVDKLLGGGGPKQSLSQL